MRTVWNRSQLYQKVRRCGEGKNKSPKRASRGRRDAVRLGTLEAVRGHGLRQESLFAVAARERSESTGATPVSRHPFELLPRAVGRAWMRVARSGHSMRGYA